MNKPLLAIFGLSLLTGCVVSPDPVQQRLAFLSQQCQWGDPNACVAYEIEYDQNQQYLIDKGLIIGGVGIGLGGVIIGSQFGHGFHGHNFHDGRFHGGMFHSGGFHGGGHHR